MTLPPGISSSTFDSALAQWRAVLTPQWVLTSPEDLQTYRDAYSPFWDEEQEPLTSAALAPATVEEVQAVVKIANQYGIPVYPFSTGRNLGYGGSAPNLSGSVVIDLKRMNRILRVDPVRHFVLVEPGVSYFDLYRYLREKNLKLMIDCPEPGWGSFVGNALDRGRGYTTTYMRDHFGAHCGMEVVMPDGTLVRTGMGAASNSDSWQDYAPGFGPSIEGLFAQGNFGIVTKMGFWLQPMPESVLGVDLTAPKYADIVPLTALLNELENSGIADGMPWLSSPVMGGQAEPPNPELQAMIGREGGPTNDELERFANGKPYWQLRLRFFGPRAVNMAKLDYVRQRASQLIPGATVGEPVHHAMPLTDEAAAGLPVALEGDRRVNLGYPNLEVFQLSARSPLNPGGSHGHVWLSPIIPRTGEEVMKMQNVITRAAMEMGAYFGANVPAPMTHIARAYVTILPFLVSDDPAQNRTMRDHFARMIDICSTHGWLEYRVHPAWQDKVRGYYNFNDHALLRVTEKLKDAVDPKGIISAGRYGIWPAAMRRNTQ